MPRRRSLTQDGIAAAALAVIDRDGLAGLSMRAVARELGVGTMSLYRYVEGREQLEGLVVHLLLAGVEAVPAGGGVTGDGGDAGDWQERVATLVGRVRGAVGVHPAAVPLLLPHRHASLVTLGWGEAVMAALADGGFTGPARAIAFRTLVAYVLGAAQVEHLGPLSGAGTAAIAELPADRYPHLSETAGVARRLSPDTEAAEGLAAVLRGLDTLRRPRDGRPGGADG